MGCLRHGLGAEKIYDIIQLDIAHNMIAVSSRIWSATPMSADLTAPIKVKGSSNPVRGVIMVRLEESTQDAAGSVTLAVGRKLSGHNKVAESVKWNGSASARTLMEVVTKWTGGA